MTRVQTCALPILIVLAAQTLCVHGDSPDAVVMARAVHQQLTEQGVAISPISQHVH